VTAAQTRLCLSKNWFSSGKSNFGNDDNG
jgi:hypothetical protein